MNNNKSEKLEKPSNRADAQQRAERLPKRPPGPTGRFLRTGRYWAAAAAALVYGGTLGTGSIIWWNTFALTLFVLTLVLFFRCKPQDVEALASRQPSFLRAGGQPGHFGRIRRGFLRLSPHRLPVAALVLSVAGFYALIASVGLPLAEELQPDAPGLAVAQGAVAVVAAWLVIHATYAIHYADLYYGNASGDTLGNTPGNIPDEGSRRGGMEFPGDEPPDYMDFWQFSCSVGTGSGLPFQVTDRGIRRRVLGHQLYSFAFNTAILALTVSFIISFVVA